MLDFIISAACASLAADAVTPEADNGFLRIYDGAKPANPGVAITTQVLLAELRFNVTAFGAAVAGVATANAFTADASANASGTASWFRALKADGTTALWDGTVGVADQPAPGDEYDLELNTTSIAAGANVSVSACTYTAPTA